MTTGPEDYTGEVYRVAALLTPEAFGQSITEPTYHSPDSPEYWAEVKRLDEVRRNAFKSAREIVGDDDRV